MTLASGRRKGWPCPFYKTMIFRKDARKVKG